MDLDARILPVLSLSALPSVPSAERDGFCPQLQLETGKSREGCADTLRDRTHAQRVADESNAENAFEMIVLEPIEPLDRVQETGTFPVTRWCRTAEAATTAKKMVKWAWCVYVD